MKSRRATQTWALLLVGSTLLGAGARPAQADEPARRDEPAPLKTSDEKTRYRDAKARFDEAQALFDQGRFEEAYAHFSAAYMSTGSPNAHLMMARCLLAQGKAPEAYKAMAATLREATSLAEAEPRYVPTRDAAAAELALLDRRVGKLIIALIDPAPRGAVVTCNGRRLSAAELGVPIPVSPGESVVELRGGGDGVLSRSILVKAGETKTLALAPSDEMASRGLIADNLLSGPAVDRAAPRRSRALYNIQMGGFALGGLGVAGMVVFGAAGSASEVKFSDMKRACGGARCSDPIYGPVVDAGKALDAAANVGLVVGLVGIVGGGALIALGGKRAAPTSAVSVSLSETARRYR